MPKRKQRDEDEVQAAASAAEEPHDSSSSSPVTGAFVSEMGNGARDSPAHLSIPPHRSPPPPLRRADTSVDLAAALPQPLQVGGLTKAGNPKKARRARSKVRSKYINVSWDSWNKKWRATIRMGSKDKHLGRFLNEVDAGAVVVFPLHLTARSRPHPHA